MAYPKTVKIISDRGVYTVRGGGLPPVSFFSKKAAERVARDRRARLKRKKTKRRRRTQSFSLMDGWKV